MLSDAIEAGVTNLRQQAASTGAELNGKFQMEARSFEMAFGSLETFYGGLEKILGPPQMVRGSLREAMKQEHCERKDAKLSFTSSNGTTTTSKMEWEIVVEPQIGKLYPERASYRTPEGVATQPGLCRRAVTLCELAKEMALVNSRLRSSGHVELLEVELVGGRLYTGPMYEKYNAVLRKESGAPALVSRCKELTKGNSYATTIHAINSCVLKLSKLTKAGRVWRGFNGASLPRDFFEPNADGVCGGIEFGFCSTTTDRAQAAAYASGGASTTIASSMGMIDRGAELGWLSQYPHEAEVLLPPLTGLEVLSTEVEGSSLLVHTRLSLNMVSLTLEQVISRRRKLLMDMADGMISEIKHAFRDAPTHAATGATILGKAIEWGSLSHPVEWFNDDEHFASAIDQALGVKRGIVESVAKLSLESKEVPRGSLAPVDAHLLCADLEASMWSESITAEQTGGKGGASAKKGGAGSKGGAVGAAKLMRRAGGTAGWHPLIWAAKDGNQVLVETLVRRGARINQHEEDKATAGFTALMWSSYRGHAKAVSVLLSHGADPTLLDRHRKTAAMHAETKGFKSIARELDFVTEHLQLGSPAADPSAGASTSDHGSAEQHTGAAGDGTAADDAVADGAVAGANGEPGKMAALTKTMLTTALASEKLQDAVVPRRGLRAGLFDRA